jgi:16S rRNA processing protein RimM
MNKKDDMVLVGYTQKPFGLIGELKVKPESFDLNRHELFKEVFFKKTMSSEAIKLEVSSSRIQNRSWLIKFKGYKSPESVKEYSGGMLFVSKDQRLPIPENQVYVSDVKGCTAIDLEGNVIGRIMEIQEHANQDILVIARESKMHSAVGKNSSVLVPWNHIFVKKVDTEKKIMIIDFSQLEGLYEN